MSRRIAQIHPRIAQLGRGIAQLSRAIAHRCERPILTIQLEQPNAPTVKIDGRIMERGTLRLYGQAERLDRRRIQIHAFTRATLDSAPITGERIEITHHHRRSQDQQISELKAIPTLTRRQIP